MEKEIKELIGGYGLWGIFICAATMIIRPFVSVKQMLRDGMITFLVSMLCGLMLEYAEMPVPVKFGISGVCGLFAVRIYLIVENVLIRAGKDPLAFIREIKGKDND